MTNSNTSKLRSCLLRVMWAVVSHFSADALDTSRASLM
jgi:hypothetical protein